VCLASLSLLGCVYDFDAYQVGEGGAGSTSSSTSSEGGASPASSTSSTSGGAGGEGGEGGAQVGGGPLPPCTPAYDFTGFDPGDDPWDDDYQVDPESDQGDAYAYVRANFGDNYGGFWWNTPQSPKNCFHSIRLEKEGGTNHGLFAYCEGSYGLRVSYEAPTRYTHVVHSANTGIPDSAGLTLSDGETLEGFRISFGEDVVVSEVRVSGSWTVLEKLARPSWLVGCELGYDMYGGTAEGSHVDDWASDPPDTSVIALP
jgi:hypothetical protein